MPETLSISSFLQSPGAILDVRTPMEYAKGHIPGSFNLPLLSNEQRAEVGTVYKRVDSISAIELALRLIPPNLRNFIALAKKFCPKHFAKILCWRGGMRSSSVALLLHQQGINTCCLKGGYKSFRKWTLDNLKKPLPIKVLTGLTGSGKTKILHCLEEMGEQILDLEALANHRGSTFGEIGPQPSNEQFENDIAKKWASFNPERAVWIEDESRLIGNCVIPADLFNQKQKAPLTQITIPFQERSENLKRDYAFFDKAKAIKATLFLKKRLGGLRTKQILHAINSGDFSSASNYLLEYYDKTYLFSLSRRTQKIESLSAEKLSPKQWAKKILAHP